MLQSVAMNEATTRALTNRPARTPLAALQAAGQRRSRSRACVAEMIIARDGPFTAAEIVEEGRRRHPRVARATVFRALELFHELGLVERLDLPSGDHAYVRCLPAHHHHLVCSSCGRSIEVPDLGLNVVTEEIRRRTGYRIDEHRLELFGICPRCQGVSVSTDRHSPQGEARKESSARPVG